MEYVSNPNQIEESEWVMLMRQTKAMDGFADNIENDQIHFQLNAWVDCSFCTKKQPDIGGIKQDV